jgi:hypothetical protein
MQSQMIGMQSSLDRILSAVQPQSQPNIGMSQPQPQQSPYSSNMESSPRRDGTGYTGTGSNDDMDMIFTIYQGQTRNGQQPFPALPGFTPPVSLCYSIEHSLCFIDHLQPHKYATYGIVPSTAPSSDDESEDTLPRATLNAPIEALQGLANAAAEAAAVPSSSTPRYDGHVSTMLCLDSGFDAG